MLGYLSRASAAITDGMNNAFAAWGLYLAKGNRPQIIVVLSLLAVAVASAGMALMTSTASAEYLFTPQNSQSWKDKRRFEALFPANETREGSLILTRTDGGNVWTAEGIAVALDLDRVVREARGVAGGVSFQFEDICLRDGPTAPCSVHSALECLTTDNANTSPNATTTNPVTVQPVPLPFPACLNAQFQPVFLPLLLGGRTVVPASVLSAEAADSNHTGGGFAADLYVTAAQALQVVYFVRASESLVEAGVGGPVAGQVEEDVAAKWESAFTDALDRVSLPSPYRVSFRSSNAVDQALEESQGADFALIATTFTLMILFSMSVVASLQSPIESRNQLALVGILCGGLAIPSSLGIGSYAGVEFVALVGTMPFLVLAVGIDDMLVLISSFNRTPVSWPVERRVSETLREGGVAVSVTSITDIIAFAIGLWTPFPAIYHFCLYTGLAVLVLFLLCITLFPACMALDARREREGRSAFTCRRLRDPMDAPNPKTLDETAHNPDAAVDGATTADAVPPSADAIQPAVERAAVSDVTAPVKNTDAGEGEGAKEQGEAGAVTAEAAAPSNDATIANTVTPTTVVTTSTATRTAHAASAAGAFPAPSSNATAVPASSPSPAGPTQSLRRTSSSRSTDSTTPAALPLAEATGYVGERWDTFFRTKLAPAVTSVPGTIVIVLLFCAYLAVGITGLTRLEQGLELKQLAPDGHFTIAYFDDEAAFFRGVGMPFQVVVEGTPSLSYAEGATREAFSQLGRSMLARDRATFDQVDQTWVDALEAFRVRTEGGALTPRPTLTEPAFQSLLLAFLRTPEAAQFENDLTFADAVTGEALPYLNFDAIVAAMEEGRSVRVASSRFTIRTVPLDDSQAQGDGMNSARATLEDALDEPGAAVLRPTFVYMQGFIFFEQYVVIVSSTIQDLGLSIAAMVVVAFFLLPRPSGVAVVIFCLIAIDLGIFGGMWLLGIRLNSISGICLVLSIGFSVDFVAHITHGFFHATGRGFMLSPSPLAPPAPRTPTPLLSSSSPFSAAASPPASPPAPSPASPPQQGAANPGMVVVDVPARSGQGSAAAAAASSSSSSSSAASSSATGVPDPATLPEFNNTFEESQLAIVAGKGVLEPAPTGVEGCFGGPSRRARASETLTVMGRPIFQGGFSTLLGLIALAFSTSYIFRIFFAMLFMTIVLGLLHAVFIVPTLLRLLGPTHLAVHRHEEEGGDHDPSKRTGAGLGGDANGGVGSPAGDASVLRVRSRGKVAPPEDEASLARVVIAPRPQIA